MGETSNAWASEDAQRSRLHAIERALARERAPDAVFDQIIQLAADTLSVPIAFISVTERGHPWVRSGVGLDMGQWSSTQALSEAAIESRRCVVVPDAMADPRTANSPLVAGPPGIRFYAAAPLITRDEYRLGCVWIADTCPRTCFSPLHERILTAFAEIALEALENRITRLHLIEELGERHRLQQRLELIESLSDSAAEARDAHQAVATLLRIVCDHFGAQFGLVIGGSHTAPDLRLVADHFSGEHGELAPLDDLIARWKTSGIGSDRFVAGILDGHRVLAIDDVRSAPDRESGFIDAARACGLRAAVLVPFQDGPRRFGVALLFKGFPRHLDDMGATIAKLSTKILPLLAMKRAETALRQEQKLARLLFENLYAPLFMFDPQLRCTTWNPALSQRTGVPEDATLGRPITDIVGRPGDPTLEDAMRAALSGETTLVHDLSFHVADTDELTSVDAYFAPLHDDDGAISGGVTFLHDVTERKRLEDMLRESQKMEAIGKLASGVAHDFNNILTVVLGNMELLRMRIPEDDSLTRLIVASEQMAGRARIIVQQMLMFAGRQRLEPTAIDVGEVVEALRDMLRQALGDRISLAIQHTANSTAARLDMTQLEIALLNLASNARDAMGNAGALTIAVGDVDAREGEIGPNSRAGRFITIRVADTGAGMSQEVSRQAFDPFFTTKAPGEGSGLGLSQVYGFVRQSGGFVQLASEAGQGTTITLFFPAASAEEVPVAEPRPKVVRGGNERILVVEDEDAVREMALGALEELGYSVLEAANADAGSVILSRDHRSIDLVFCDIAMLGKLQGIELARLALGLQPPIKVLLTSGYGERVRQSSAFPAGARFLAKPYNVRDLATAVRTTLDRNAGQG